MPALFFSIEIDILYNKIQKINYKSTYIEIRGLYHSPHDSGMNLKSHLSKHLYSLQYTFYVYIVFSSCLTHGHAYMSYQTLKVKTGS